MSFSSNFAIAKQNAKIKKVDKMYCCISCLFLFLFWTGIIYASVCIFFRQPLF